MDSFLDRDGDMSNLCSFLINQEIPVSHHGQLGSDFALVGFV
jgi:hypothetical protein